MPRRTKFKDLKAVVKESYPWLKDLDTDNFRFWRLYPDVRDQEFLDQYNQQLQAGQLPTLLKFPGFSLENSMDFYLEEYGTMQFQKQVVFVEVKKHRGQWVFSFSPEEPETFDEGAINFSKHKLIYTEQSGEGAPGLGFYNQYYKFHNSSGRDNLTAQNQQEALEQDRTVTQNSTSCKKATPNSKEIYSKVFE